MGYRQATVAILFLKFKSRRVAAPLAMSIGHRAGEIDLTDYLLGLSYLVSVIGATQIGQVSLYEHGMGDALWSGDGVTITVGFVIGLVSFAGAWATNQVPLGELDEVETAAAIGVVVIFVAVSLIPPVREAVTGSQVWGSVAAVLSIAGYTLIAWK